jgi:hypothetical protein
VAMLLSVCLMHRGLAVRLSLMLTVSALGCSSGDQPGVRRGSAAPASVAERAVAELRLIESQLSDGETSRLRDWTQKTLVAARDSGKALEELCAAAAHARMMVANVHATRSSSGSGFEVLVELCRELQHLLATEVMPPLECVVNPAEIVRNLIASETSRYLPGEIRFLSPPIVTRLDEDFIQSVRREIRRVTHEEMEHGSLSLLNHPLLNGDQKKVLGSVYIEQMLREVVVRKYFTDQLNERVRIMQQLGFDLKECEDCRSNEDEVTTFKDVEGGRPDEVSQELVVAWAASVGLIPASDNSLTGDNEDGCLRSWAFETHLESVGSMHSQLRIRGMIARSGAWWGISISSVEGKDGPAMAAKFLDSRCFLFDSATGRLYWRDHMNPDVGGGFPVELGVDPAHSHLAENYDFGDVRSVFRCLADVCGSLEPDNLEPAGIEADSTDGDGTEAKFLSLAAPLYVSPNNDAVRLRLHPITYSSDIHACRRFPDERPVASLKLVTNLFPDGWSVRKSRLDKTGGVAAGSLTQVAGAGRISARTSAIQRLSAKKPAGGADIPDLIFQYLDRQVSLKMNKLRRDFLLAMTEVSAHERCRSASELYVRSMAVEENSGNLHVYDAIDLMDIRLELLACLGRPEELLPSLDRLAILNQVDDENSTVKFRLPLLASHIRDERRHLAGYHPHGSLLGFGACGAPHSLQHRGLYERWMMAPSVKEGPDGCPDCRNSAASRPFSGVRELGPVLREWVERQQLPEERRDFTLHLFADLSDGNEPFAPSGIDRILKRTAAILEQYDATLAGDSAADFVNRMESLKWRIFHLVRAIQTPLCSHCHGQKAAQLDDLAELIADLEEQALKVNSATTESPKEARTAYHRGLLKQLFDSDNSLMLFHGLSNARFRDLMSSVQATGLSNLKNVQDRLNYAEREFVDHALNAARNPVESRELIDFHMDSFSRFRRAEGDRFVSSVMSRIALGYAKGFREFRFGDTEVFPFVAPVSFTLTYKGGVELFPNLSVKMAGH